MGLQPLVCWDPGFDSPPGARISASCECYVCLGRGLCDGLSLVQRSPTECGVSECGSEASIMRTPWPTGGCCAMAGGGIYSAGDTVMFSVSYYCLRCHGLVLDHTILSMTLHSTLVQCRIDTSWVNSSKNCAFFFTEWLFNSVHWFTKRFRQMMTCLTYRGVNRLQPCLGLAFFFPRCSFTKLLPFSSHSFFITMLASLSTSAHTKWFL
jgi:hypothetical protein